MKHLLLNLILLGSAVAQEPPSALTVEVRSIIDEYENSVRANTLKIIAATTEEEKNKYRSSIPSAGPYATKQTPSLPDSDPQSNATLKKQIPIRNAATVLVSAAAEQSSEKSESAKQGPGRLGDACDACDHDVVDPVRTRG